MKIKENLINEIIKRKSRRSFLKEGIDEEKESLIFEILNEINMEEGLSFKAVLNKGDSVFKGFNSYGFIKNCSSYIILVGDTEAENIEEKVGYFGEYLVLKLESLGYGSCWLGGTYSKAEVKKEIKLGDSDKIYCIIAFGLPSEDKGFIEKFIAYRKSKKPLISYASMFEGYESLNEEEKIWINQALDAARLSPSALNKKPWKFKKIDEKIIVDCIPNHGFEKIDMGIAMLHFEQGSGEIKIGRQWEKINDRWEF